MSKIYNFFPLSIYRGKIELPENTKKEMVKENPTLVKNMKHVKWKEIPPLRGPNPQGLIKDKKQDKKKQENLNGRNR